MRFLANKPLIALVGAVAFPVAALLYLAGRPGGRGSGLAIALQVAIVLLSLVLFAVFLARVLDQVNAGRVRRWLASEEGREWLAELPEDERVEFLDRLAGKATPRPADPETDPGGAGPDPVGPESRVDSPGGGR